MALLHVVFVLCVLSSWSRMCPTTRNWFVQGVLLGMPGRRCGGLADIAAVAGNDG